MNLKPLNTTSKVALTLIAATGATALVLVIQFWLSLPGVGPLSWQTLASLAMGPAGPSAAVGYLHGYWIPFGVFMGGSITGILLLVFSLRQPRP